MSTSFLDDHLLYQFVSATYTAQTTENETGIGMCWADFDINGELEQELPQFSSKVEEKFEKQLRKAANDPAIKELFALMGDGVDEEELKELQDSVKEKAEP